MESPPHNSAPTGLHQRSFSTGKLRANYRDFGLPRHILREMVHACLLPGATQVQPCTAMRSNFKPFAPFACQLQNRPITCNYRIKAQTSHIDSQA
ncbi:hypothetical protein Pint_34119 [Pistacia integerrima]|uniref:Uncharacterized protein n=1 Tax=Pistacia integerrima TaxID=434235 RepID=A0ACC0X3H1_9ROSI|nr:hypothetical protein Pint_34119 [Pistacia integerrima]